RLSFSDTTLGGARYNPALRVIDPFGRDIFGPYELRNAPVLDVLHDGTYTLLFEGATYETAASLTYGFTLSEVVDTSTELTLGETVEGEIATAHGSDSYTFTLGETTDVVLDILSRSDDGRVRISGPNGFIRTLHLTDADSADTSVNPFMRLAAGDYRLTITSDDNWNRPAYSLRLLDAASADTVDLETAVSGTLSPGAETDIYRFDVEAGQVVSIGEVTNTGGRYNAYFRLIDPLGQVIAGPTRLSGQGAQELQLAGTYTLLIEGRVYEDDGNEIAYGFRLVDPQDPDPVEITVGESVAAEIARAGQSHRFTFDLGQDTRLYLDS
ncbi:hypothetical protein AB9K41_14555, partial [Cribrihabitans sp. XS_ASV171]